MAVVGEAETTITTKVSVTTRPTKAVAMEDSKEAGEKTSVNADSTEAMGEGMATGDKKNGMVEETATEVGDMVMDHLVVRVVAMMKAVMAVKKGLGASVLMSAVMKRGTVAALRAEDMVEAVVMAGAQVQGMEEVGLATLTRMKCYGTASDMAIRATAISSLKPCLS